MIWRIWRIAALVAINVAVFVVAAELIALGVFYYQTGWLYYIDPYRVQLAAVPDAGQGRLTTVALHPYFGPTHQAGIPYDPPESLRGSAPSRVATNNFGFVSAYDYPFTRANQRQFVVGLFGGSVGAWFCQVGAERLVARLSESPALRGREIVPLCFSHEGYKQPQQLLLLSYFLSIGQTFDVVVNIDGFNEVALSRLNDERGSDISMPSVMHMDPLTNVMDQSSLTSEKVDSLARMQDGRRRLNALADRGNRTRLASIYLVLSRLHAAASREYQAEVARFAQLPAATGTASLVRVTPKVRTRDGAALYEDIAQNWVRSSLLMQQMLAARGVPYVHVLQPNQYFTTRVFPPEQAAVARAADSPFKPGAEQGYPYLEKAMASGELARAGVTVVDGVHLFDGEAAPVYMDNCCHYTRLGNVILADAVAKAILK
jgi:hypothetical protein